MTKQQFIPQTDENRYLNTTHKVNLTGSEISTILYYLDQVADDIGEAYIPSPDVERIYNVQHWTEMPRGGHFAAMEEPELLLNDIRKFARSLRSKNS